MLGLSKIELETFLEGYGLVKGQEVNAVQLADTIAQVIVDNNKAIERQLIKTGVIKRD
ncbi:hypothetical protein ACFLW0_03810 [Chloroflexota bacterium]